MARDEHTERWIKSEIGPQIVDGSSINPSAVSVGGSPAITSVVATGNVTLASGTATVDTGVPTTETATFMVALGPQTSDSDISADIRDDSTSGNYEVDIEETGDTAVGNPTVEYDIIRVR